MLVPRRMDPESGAVRALAVSPADDDRRALRNLLSQPAWWLDAVSSIAEARSWLMRFGPPPIIICDRDLPDGNWKCFFQETETLPRPPRFVVCSRLADEYLWAEALNLGGYDVLATPFDAQEVIHVVTGASDSWRRQWGQNSMSRPQSPSRPHRFGRALHQNGAIR